MNEAVQDDFTPSVARANNGRTRDMVLTAVVYLAFSVLLPLHRFDLAHLTRIEIALLIVVPTVVFMFLQLAMTLSIVRLDMTPAKYLLLAIGSLVAWFLILFFFRFGHASNYTVWLLARLFRSVLLGLALTFSLSSFGILLSLIIRERNILLPVALISMPIDYLGAMTPTGFTHDMVAHAGKIVSAVSVSVPAVSLHGFSIGPIAFIGPGDVLFMALFFAAVQRFELAERATFWWMFALLSLSMVLVVRLPNFPVGALVPMGLAVILANLGLIKLKRDEVFAVLYAGALILIIVTLFFWTSHRYLFHSR